MGLLQTTLCYLEQDGCYLMLHRVKKKQDVNHDKWIGVGGKFEPGETALAYLTGGRGLLPYRLLYALAAWWGASESLEVVWGLSDIFNALMAAPNLLSLLLLSGVLVRETRYWLWEKRLDEYSKDDIPVIDK